MLVTEILTIWVENIFRLWKWWQPPTTAILRTPLTQSIRFQQIMSLLGSKHSLSCLPLSYCASRVLKITSLTKTTIWKELAGWFGSFLLWWDIGLAGCLCFIALLSRCVLLICSVLHPWTWHSGVYLTGTKRGTHCRSDCSARWWPRLL